MPIDETGARTRTQPWARALGALVGGLFRLCLRLGVSVSLILLGAATLGAGAAGASDIFSALSVCLGGATSGAALLARLEPASLTAGVEDTGE